MGRNRGRDGKAVVRSGKTVRMVIVEAIRRSADNQKAAKLNEDLYDSYLPDWLLEAFLREIPVGGGLRFLLVDGSSGRVYRYRDSRIVQNVRIAVHGDGKRGDT